MTRESELMTFSGRTIGAMQISYRLRSSGGFGDHCRRAPPHLKVQSLCRINLWTNRLCSAISIRTILVTRSPSTRFTTSLKSSLTCEPAKVLLRSPIKMITARSGCIRNGLFYRGERIRTSDLLVPNQISRLVGACRNVWNFDALY